MVINNVGLLTDKYDIDLSFDGPAGWILEYTTENGTFPPGQTDSVEVNSWRINSYYRKCESKLV